MAYLLMFVFWWVTNISAYGQEVASPCDTGISDAPCSAIGTRIIIVAKDGTGQYSDIQPAIDAANPGDNILIKPGVYKNSGTSCGNPFITMQRNGTKDAPIYIGPYDPLHPPLIAADFQIGCGSPVVGGQWVIVEGLEFTSEYSTGSGLRGFADHLTIRKNWFHNNKYQGMWQDGAHQLIEGNTFEHNGDQGQNIGCTGPWETPGVQKWDPAHCHGIYGGVVYPPTPTNCRTPHHVTIRQNYFNNNSGSGYQLFINASSCNDPTYGRKGHEYLIENNVLVNNAYTFFIVGLVESTIRNNTSISLTFPEQASNRTLGFIDWYDTPLPTLPKLPLRVVNNLFYSRIPANPTGTSLFLMSCQTLNDCKNIDMDWNHYYVKSDARFRGAYNGGTFQAYSYFSNKWKSVTGKDPHGLIFNVDTANANLENIDLGNYRPKANASVINAGNAADCPKTDFDGKLRTDGQCDIGAFEFSSSLNSPNALQLNINP